VQNAESTDTTCGEDFRLETFDNGESPRFPMKLRLDVGETDTTHLQAELNTSSDSMPSSTTNLTGDFLATVSQINGEDLTISAEWKDATVSGPNGDAIAQQLIGKKADIGLTTAMRPLAKAGELSGDASAMTASQITAFSSRYLTPFPKGNVGVGAQWQVWVADDLGMGSQPCTVSTYKLEHFDGTNYVISGNLTMLIPEGTTSEDKDFGTGAIVTTVSTTSGSGGQTITVSGSLDHFYPDSQQIDAGLDMSMHSEISVESTKQTVDEYRTQGTKATYSRS
jgi:hypothetical protein